MPFTSAKVYGAQACENGAVESSYGYQCPFTVSKLVSHEFSSRLHRTADLRRGDETLHRLV